MKGRPPKPLALRVLEGNRGHRQLLNPLKPETTVPTCPKTLQGESRREWYRVTKELQHLGLIAKVDRAALVSYCVAWGRLMQAEEHLIREGAVVEGRQAGKVKNPWSTIQNQAMTQIKAFAAEFGLSPSSRGRLMVPGREKKSLSEIAKERAEANRAQWQRERKPGGGAS